MVTVGIFPFKENSHGRAGDRTRDLMISSQKLWPLDHEAGLWKKCIVTESPLIPFSGYDMFLQYQRRTNAKLLRQTTNFLLLTCFEMLAPQFARSHLPFQLF